MEKMHNDVAEHEARLEFQSEISALEQTLNRLYDKIDERWKQIYEPSQPVPPQLESDPELGGWGEQIYKLRQELTEKQIDFQKQYGVWPTPRSSESPEAIRDAYRREQDFIIAVGAYQKLLARRLDDYYNSLQRTGRGIIIETELDAQGNPKLRLSKQEAADMAVLSGDLDTAIKSARRTLSGHAALLDRHGELNESIREPHYIDHRDDWK